MRATRWDDNYSAQWVGYYSHPHVGGLVGFTDSVMLTRHEPGWPPALWRVALTAGSEVVGIVGGNFEGHAVMDDFGNLAGVKQ